MFVVHRKTQIVSVFMWPYKYKDWGHLGHIASGFPHWIQKRNEVTKSTEFFAVGTLWNCDTMQQKNVML